MVKDDVSIELRAFANRVSYICGLENNKKITTEEAYKMIKKHYKALKKYLKSLTEDDQEGGTA